MSLALKVANSVAMAVGELAAGLIDVVTTRGGDIHKARGLRPHLVQGLEDRSSHASAAPRLRPRTNGRWSRSTR
eukprot:52956-Prymnesium_polylepis.1